MTNAHLGQRLGRDRAARSVARARARRVAAGGAVGRPKVQPPLREGLRSAFDGRGVRGYGPDGAISLPHLGELVLGEFFFRVFMWTDFSCTALLIGGTCKDWKYIRFLCVP